MSFCIILRRWPLLKFLASLLPNPQRREFASRAWERKLRISRCFVQGHIVDWCSSIWGANECCFSTFWSSPNLQERWEYLDIAFFECLSTLSWRVIFIQKIKFAELEFTRGHQMSTVVRGLQGRDGPFLRMVHFSRWILWKCHMPNMFFRCFFPHLEHHKNPPRILFCGQRWFLWAKDAVAFLRSSRWSGLWACYRRVFCEDLKIWIFDDISDVRLISGTGASFRCATAGWGTRNSSNLKIFRHFRYQVRPERVSSTKVLAALLPMCCLPYARSILRGHTKDTWWNRFCWSLKSRSWNLK